MTDNEIIKALENIVNEKIGCCKEDCNFYDGKVHSCEKTIAKHSLDLINRQKAEIENLEKVIDAIENHINPLPFETDFDKAIKNAKVETIKEFKQTVRTLFRLTFLRRKCYDKIFDEVEEMLLKRNGGCE